MPKIPCPLPAQENDIHDDMSRLLDPDSTTNVECCGFKFQHLSTEALTYGNAEARKETCRKSNRIKAALYFLYMDTQTKQEQLTHALCDLRHFADQQGLDFGLHDKDAHQYYSKERQAELEGLGQCQSDSIR